MNGDGGITIPSHEPPQLWVFSEGVLHRGTAADGIACQLEAGLGGAVWYATTRQLAYAWFVEQFKVTVTFEQFDAALQRDYPLSHARMLENERAEAALGYDFANIHLMTTPPKS